MDKIKIELSIDAGTPFEFLSNAEPVVESLRLYFDHLKEHIIAYDGYITVRQRNDGNFSIQAHCTDRITLEEMDKVIISFLDNYEQ